MTLSPLSVKARPYFRTATGRCVRVHGGSGWLFLVADDGGGSGGGGGKEVRCRRSEVG